MTLETTYGFPQDVWNETLSHCDFSTLKACCYISKTFTDIVETSSVYILERFHLDRAENGKLAFRRIISLGNLFHKWTNQDSLPSDSIRSVENLELFKDYLLKGINPFNYQTFDCRANYSQSQIALYLRTCVVIKFQKSPLSSSLPEILACTANHIRKDDDRGLAIRTIVYMTSHFEVRNHPAKKDLIDLFANNLNDLPLLLNYHPEKADALLNQDFTNLANEHIQTLILSYLCNHDIKRVQNLISLIKGKGWTFNADLAKAKPDLQKILTSSYDDELSLFLELLLLYKDEIEQITNKTLVSHVCTNGNALLLKKLKDDYNINLADDPSCFHYASNADIAQTLFESGANIHSSCGYCSPLAIAFIFNKVDVAAFLIEKRADLFANNFPPTSSKNPLSYTTNPNTFQLLIKKVNTFSLIGFLLPRSLKEIGQNKMLTWIALKELAIRVASVAICTLALVLSIQIGYGSTFHSWPNIIHFSSITILTGLQYIFESQYKY